MIRRDDQENWLIIDQKDHARVAVELAGVWGKEPFVAEPSETASIIRSSEPVDDFKLRVALRFAIEHHDDGWAEWDRALRIDPNTGVPRDFREMRMHDATAIWTQSISICTVWPVAGYAVSRHFCYLASQVQKGGRHDSADLQSVAQFLHDQATLQQNLRDEAQRIGRGEEFVQGGETGFRAVQFFDRLSLWLCCAEEHELETFTDPQGRPYSLIPRMESQVVEARHPPAFLPRNPARDQRNWQVAIEPFPLTVASLELATDARQIPARLYADDADLQAALNEAATIRLVWTIGPA